MLQAIMTSPGQIEFVEIMKPKPIKNQVLIKIMRIGVCGSDIHVNHGLHPYTTYPVVQGHEVSGEISEIGEDIKKFKIGDKVTIMPQEVCGKCFSCNNGKYNICDELKVMGFQTTGTASEYFLVDGEKVLKLPNVVSFDEGAMIEPVAVAIHALKRTDSVRNKKILVLGGGPIGNLVGQSAKALGAKSVMITDISNFRLEKAKECGIDFCINTKSKKLSDEIKNAFGEDKADLILDCAGLNVTINQALENARKGTDIVIVGVYGGKPCIDLGLVQDRELRIIGTLMYQEEDYRIAIDFINQGKLKLKPIVTDYFDFKDYKKAYDYIDEKKDQIMKVMIKIHE